jgi:archaellum biogenesis protein FlaJ (TadC family)
MNIKVGVLYTLNFVINGKLLTYTGKIVSTDDIFITFIDKYGKEVSWNKNTLANYAEVME